MTRRFITPLLESATGDPTLGWPPAPDRLELSRGVVDLWGINLDQPPVRAGAVSATLSHDEVQRANRFVFEEDRRRFMVGRWLLRSVLGRYLGLQPGFVDFEYGHAGKPSVNGPFTADPVEFNLSHSGPIALLAVTVGTRVGVDLEGIRPIPEADDLARHNFSAWERSELSLVPDDVKNEAFLNCWTRKEAFVKALGDGLVWPLDQFDVSIAPGSPVCLLRVEGEPHAHRRWSLLDLNLGAGYTGALAVESPLAQVRRWRHPRSKRHYGNQSPIRPFARRPL